MKRVILIGFLVCFICLLFQKPIFADIVNPEYFISKCANTEAEIECHYKSKIAFGPRTYDECIKYENNSNYRFLVSRGSSFGGSEKYCYKPKSNVDSVIYYIKTLLPIIFITILFELPIFWIFISKSHKALRTVIFANLISVPIINLTVMNTPSVGIFFLLFLELMVIIFETWFIKLFLKEIKLNKILIYSFFANAISATAGSLFLTFIQNLLK